MNIDKLTEIAEWLEAGAPERDGVVKFNMKNFIVPEGCGTACCIAGAVVQFSSALPFRSSKHFYVESPLSIRDAAESLLGLDYHESEELFYAPSVLEKFEDELPHGADALDMITPAWAARCIRNLIETGKVDWLGTYVPV